MFVVEKIEKMNNTDFDNMDLDFTIDQDGDNLFEEFHKAKKEGKDNADIISKEIKPPVIETEAEKAARLESLKLQEDKLKKDSEMDSFLTDSLNGFKNIKKDDSSKDNSSKDDNQESVFAILYKANVEKGIWKEVDGFDGTEDSYFEAQRLNDEDKKQQGLGEMIAEMFEDNPNKSNAEIALDFLRHLALNGNPKDYISVISKTEIDEEDLESDDALVKETAQRKVYFEYWKEQGLDEAQVTKKFNTAKLKEILDDEVETLYPLLKNKRNNEKKELVAKTTSAKMKNESAIQTFNNSLIENVEKNTEIFGLPISENKKEKAELLNYMFKNSVKTNSGRAVPQFSVDREALNKDPNWILFQAIAAKQIKATGKLDFKILEKQIEKSKTLSLNDKLSAIMKGQKKQIDNSLEGEIDMSMVADLDLENL